MKISRIEELTELGLSSIGNGKQKEKDKDIFYPHTYEQIGELQRWGRLKVSKCVDFDQIDNFYSVFDCAWWRTLIELDMYEEDLKEGVNKINKRNFNSALKWLKETQNLTIDFKKVKINH